MNLHISSFYCNLPLQQAQVQLSYLTEITIFSLHSAKKLKHCKKAKKYLPNCGQIFIEVHQFEDHPKLRLFK